VAPLAAGMPSTLTKTTQARHLVHCPPLLTAARTSVRVQALESRVYTLTSPWRQKPLPPFPHLVRVGERVEVEVEETKGAIEWRQATVAELLGGGKGRFSVVVDGPDGTPDDDFVEVFTAPLMGTEWRKISPPPKPAGKAGPTRKTRVSDGGTGGAGSEQDSAGSGGGGGAGTSSLASDASLAGIPAAKKAKIEQAELMSTSDDGKSVSMLSTDAAMKKLKPSKNKIEVAIYRALHPLSEAQKEHAASACRLYQQAVIRLHEQAQQAVLDAAAAAEAEAAAAAAAAAAPTVPPDSAATADATASERAAVADGAAASVDVHNRRSGEATAVPAHPQLSAAEARAAARSARSTARQAVADAERARLEDAKASEKEHADAQDVANEPDIALSSLPLEMGTSMEVDPPTTSASTHSANCLSSPDEHTLSVAVVSPGVVEPLIESPVEVTSAADAHLPVASMPSEGASVGSVAATQSMLL
jgi:hypothetical protein